MSIPTPPMREAVQVKYRSTNSLSRPIASKIWAPRYDWMVEIPIFEMTLRIPLLSALT